MNSKPFIGINGDFRNAQGDKPAFSYLASGYYDAISEIGGLPLVIPPLAEDDDLNAVLDRLDGVLFVGVENHAWMTELSLMEAQLLARINARDGHAPVKRIRWELRRG